MNTEFPLGDMPVSEFKENGYKLIDWVADYLSDMESLPVLPPIQPGDIKKHIPSTPPFAAENMEDIIPDINKIIVPGITHWNHPNFMAYFVSSASGPGILGELVASAINTNGMVWKSNPSSTELEETVLNWFREMIGLPKNYFGIVYDTASVSTMHAIATARENTGLNIRQHGFAGQPKLRMYCSEHAHSSVDKAVITLGIGLDGLRKIPCDSNFSMIPSELENAIEEDRQNGWQPFCVVATIGTTSTTSIDPVDEINKICKKENLWLHVDSAYAGVTAMLPEMKSLFKGMDEADSIVINPHKWLFVPLDFSILFISKPEVLKRAFSLVPDYLVTAEDNKAINYMDYGIQLGRRFRSLKFWFVLRYFGVEGLQARLREHIRLGQLFASWIDENTSFKRMAPVPFSVVCFRAVPNKLMSDKELDEFNSLLMDKINSTGKIFLSHTKLNGKFVIRLVVGGIRTEEKHVRLAWEVIQKIFDEMIAV
ncbi:MAG: pyridoxal-dependent decarboxylase [bacterium]